MWKVYIGPYGLADYLPSVAYTTYPLIGKDVTLDEAIRLSDEYNERNKDD